MNTEFRKMISTIVRRDAVFDLEEFDREAEQLKRSLIGCNEEERMKKIKEVVFKRDVNNIQPKPELKIRCINIRDNKASKKRKTVEVDNSSSPVSGVLLEGSSSSPSNPKGKRKKIPKFNYSTATGLPNSLLEKINRLGGGGVILIIQKELSITDLNDGHNRLSLPKSQMKDGSFTFLNPGEREYLDSDGDENGSPKMIVGFIEPSGTMDEITLGKWNMGERKDKTKNRMYNLMHSWNKVVIANKLKAGRSIQLWAFRVQSKLWFALVSL